MSRSKRNRRKENNCSLNGEKAFNDISVRKIPVQVQGEETNRKEEANRREEAKRREEANARQRRSSPPKEQKKIDKNILNKPSVDIRNRSPSANVDSFFNEANRKFDSFSLPMERMGLHGGSSGVSQSNSKSSSTSVVNGRKISKTTSIQNGKETILTYENDVLVKKLVNGIPEAI